MGRSDFPPFFKYLESHQLAHYAELFYNNGYSLANLDRLGDGDLRSLGIRGTKETAKILGAVSFFRDNEAQVLASTRVRPLSRARWRSPKKLRAAAAVREVREAAGDGETTVAEAGDDDGSATPAASSTEAAGEAYPEYTASIPTANECARQATVFLAHQRVDRDWPRKASNLTRSLNLSTAAPKMGVSTLYSIAGDDGERVDVKEPCRHEHGHSAKFCRTCADHISDGIKGQWQYLTNEVVDLGGGTVTEVPVWKPFDAKDSIRIEFNFKKKDKAVKIRGKVADLEKMVWGKHPIRRVDGAAVPFPTLNPRDVASPPRRRSVATDHCSTEMARLHLELVEKMERTDRIGIEQLEAREFADIAALSVAMVMKMFDDQRLALEEEEAAARAQIEADDLERALDDIWTAFEDSMRAVAFETARREADVVAAQQRNVLENMEAIEREDIESEEEALRSNLDKLATLLHTQMKDIIARAKKGEADLSNAAKHSGLRCPICRRKDCVFFRNKWKNHWRHHGGALDLSNPEVVHDTLSNLIGRSCEAEYREYNLNRKAALERKRDRVRLLQYTGVLRPSSRASQGTQRAATPGAQVRRGETPTFSLPSPIEEGAASPSGGTSRGLGQGMNVSVGSTGPAGDPSITRERPRSATPGGRKAFHVGRVPKPAFEASFQCSKRV